MQQNLKLQAFLAHAGIASRRSAEILIRDGLVTVNEQPAHIGQRITPMVDKVKVKGKPVGTDESFSYFILNKPQHVISTTSDELHRKTVLDFFPKKKGERMYPVGRLDAESEGLILLTNDGELTYLFTHPKFRIEKTYHVFIEGVPSTPALEHLKRGIKLSGEYVRPVKMSILKRENMNTWLEIVIAEGKKHQVRKMMSSTGYEVLRLIRVKMGPLELGELSSGETRAVSQKEMSNINDLKLQVKSAIQSTKK